MVERDFSNLVPPPRKLPLSLTLFVLFVRQVIILPIGFIWILIVVSVLKNSVGGRHFTSIQVIFYLFLAIGVIILITNLIKDIRNYNFLVNGNLTFGTRLSRTERIVQYGRNNTNTAKIITFNFEHAVNQRKYVLEKEFKNESTKLVDEESKAPILYLEDDPNKAMLLDSLHARINIDELGLFRLHYPIEGFIVFVIFKVSFCGLVLFLLGKLI